LCCTKHSDASIFPISGFILFAFAASHSQAQVHILQLNPSPKLEAASAQRVKMDNVTANPATLAVSVPITGSAMPNAPTSKVRPICGITRLGRCIQDLGEDEKGIFTSPLRLQPKDAYWLAPSAQPLDSHLLMMPMLRKQQA
jgi:hypothetical protein